MKKVMADLWQIMVVFILFMAFSRQEYWSGLPFPSPVDHILSDLSTITHSSSVAPHSMTNAKVGTQEIPGVAGNFGPGVQNEAGQR